MIDVRAWIDISMCFGKKKQVLTQQPSFMFRYHYIFPGVLGARGQEAGLARLPSG
jgi:hypothetical protein